MSELGAAWRAHALPAVSTPAPSTPVAPPPARPRRGRRALAWAILGAALLIPALVDAQTVDVDLLIYHAEVHPETGEPCGGAFAGPGLTTLNIFFDNIEFNARDEQESWPERAFPRIEPGDGGRLSVRLGWSPGDPRFNVPPGLQSTYAVRIGWTDRDVIRSDRRVNLDPHQIVVPQRHYVTRDGWTTVNPGNDYSRHGVIVCNRPPATITTTAIFQDRDPGSVFLGWRHTGGLGEAHDWSRTEVFLEPQPELPRFGQPIFTQAAWGSTNRIVRDLDCGQYFACYRSVDDYGHVWEGCDGDIVVDRCVMDEPDMAVPDMAVPDMAVPDMAVPDMALPDMALPDAAPDMAPPIQDMAVVIPDMAPPVQDMAVVIPDMAPPVQDMAPPVRDMALATPDATPIPDMIIATPDATPTPDMAPIVDAQVDMAEADPQPDVEPAPRPDMARAPDAAEGDPQPEAGANTDATAGTDAAVDTGADPDEGDCATAPGTSGSGWGWALLALLALRRRR